MAVTTAHVVPEDYDLDREDQRQVKLNNRIIIHSDVDLCEACYETENRDFLYDAIVLPGGLGGAEAFCKDKRVGKLLNAHFSQNKVVAAICASPTALKAHGIGYGYKITSYPSFKSQLSNDYVYTEDEVAIDRNLITSRGPATTFAFALKIVEVLL